MAQLSVPRLPTDEVELVAFGVQTALGTGGAKQISTAIDLRQIATATYGNVPADYIHLMALWANGGTILNADPEFRVWPAPSLKTANEIGNLIANNPVQPRIIDVSADLIQSPTTLDGAATATQAQITVVSTTNYAVNQNVVIDNGSAVRDHCYRLVSIDSGTTMSLDRGALESYASGSTVRQLLVLHFPIDVRGLGGVVFEVKHTATTGSDPLYGLYAGGIRSGSLLT